ncbi:TPA: isoprenylcysteine carboxyl methyltransferase family protein [Streptococcus agalactiae]|nr:isoprenylcysteine carboxyl methyltransferase family protein [Streptococcus agalactiae]
MSIIIELMAAMFIIRLAYLKLSIANEKALRKNGAKEYGVGVSKAITVLHIIIYFSSVTEAILTKASFNFVSVIGLSLMIFSVFMLHTVTRLLGRIWTVKLMVDKNHQFVDHWLFRVVKHPNYFLNIAPELLGVTLLCHAKYTALFVLPIYAFVIYLRIREENLLLKTIIIPNGIKKSRVY